MSEQQDVDVVVLTTTPYTKIRLSDADLSDYHRNLVTEDMLVVEALERKGLSARRVGWDDPHFNWLSPKAIVVRTIWDYFTRYDEFSDWLEKVSSQNVFLMNSAELIAWNVDKHYLNELHERGVKICTTTFVEIGVLAHENTTLSKLIEENLEWDDFVIKPCISAASRETYRVQRGAVPPEVDARYAQLNKDEAFMVQPFQRNVLTQGELSIIIFQGKISHAMLKKAPEGEFRVQDLFGGTVSICSSIGEEERAFALKCYAACPEPPLFARVDIIRDNNDHWVLAEMEIIEPELWFRFCPQAADHLAEGVVTRLYAALSKTTDIPPPAASAGDETV
jgi:glutathione synthase/RimK-type ligase-like ATP-grasp enzyme